MGNTPAAQMDNDALGAVVKFGGDDHYLVTSIQCVLVDFGA